MLCLPYAGFFFEIFVKKFTFWGGEEGVNANLEKVYILDIFFGTLPLEYLWKENFDGTLKEQTKNYS